MKKILYIFSALCALMLVSCKPQITPEQPDDPETEIVPVPIPDPDPVPDEPTFEDNIIYFLDASGNITEEIEVKSATSFVYNGGYFSFYLGNMEGLTPELIGEGLELKEGDSIVAAAILNSFNGKKVVINEEKRRYTFQTRIDGLDPMDVNENEVSGNVSGGWFILTVDREGMKATFEFEVELSDGTTMKSKTTADYVPGGEVENFVTMGDDYERPLRVGFYDEPIRDGFEPTLYLAVGEIEYGEDIPRTAYVAMAAASSICDGEPHYIAECMASDKLIIGFFNIEGYLYWDILDGQIIIDKKGEYDYEISISAGYATEEYGEVEDTSFEMFWSGSLKDMSITRPINSELSYNGKVTPLKSAVIDITGTLGYVYLCPSEGITTVEAAKADNPLVVTVSAEKVFNNVGLSTDRENFSISYDGNTWDKETLDTCSYIVHDYTEDIIHCQVANFSLKKGKTKLMLEYKGPMTVIR